MYSPLSCTNSLSSCGCGTNMNIFIMTLSYISLSLSPHTLSIALSCVCLFWLVELNVLCRYLYVLFVLLVSFTSRCHVSSGGSLVSRSLVYICEVTTLQRVGSLVARWVKSGWWINISGLDDRLVDKDLNLALRKTADWWINISGLDDRRLIKI